jgi:hypothetical protein
MKTIVLLVFCISLCKMSHKVVYLSIFTHKQTTQKDMIARLCNAEGKGNGMG